MEAVSTASSIPGLHLCLPSPDTGSSISSLCPWQVQHKLPSSERSLAIPCLWRGSQSLCQAPAVCQGPPPAAVDSIMPVLEEGVYPNRKWAGTTSSCSGRVVCLSFPNPLVLAPCPKLSKPGVDRCWALLGNPNIGPVTCPNYCTADLTQSLSRLGWGD